MYGRTVCRQTEHTAGWVLSGVILSNGTETQYLCVVSCRGCACVNSYGSTLVPNISKCFVVLSQNDIIHFQLFSLTMRPSPVTTHHLCGATLYIHCTSCTNSSPTIGHLEGFSRTMAQRQLVFYYFIIFCNLCLVYCF